MCIMLAGYAAVSQTPGLLYLLFAKPSRLTTGVSKDLCGGPLYSLCSVSHITPAPLRTWRSMALIYNSQVDSVISQILSVLVAVIRAFPPRPLSQLSYI